MIKNLKCKICRRSGVKLFLKGEKCFSNKCPLIRKPYPPGPQSKKRRNFFSEYATQLSEKQKLKRWYNLSERQFKRYVKDVLGRKGHIGDAQKLFMQRLETRLDNVIFRSGFAFSRTQARQLVNHGHFLLNDKKVNIPSCRVKNGDNIKLRKTSAKKAFFTDIALRIKTSTQPSWLKLDIKKLEVKVVGEPTLEEAALPAQITTIFEFYSR